jgi:biopolymer transport protein ExbB
MIKKRFLARSTAYTLLLLIGLFSLTSLHDLRAQEYHVHDAGTTAVSRQSPESTEELQGKGSLSQEMKTIPAKKKDENLFATVKEGGPLMIFLILLEIIAMMIILERSIFFSRNRIWTGEYLEKILRERATVSNALYREDLEEELTKIFSRYSSKMERGLSLLSGIGNLAPITGFLGTVIGMISAFASIAAATTVNAKIVAVGIQIALVTTAGGLIVAAPALAFFYFFTHVIQRRHEQAEELIAELTDILPGMSLQLNDTTQENVLEARNQ